MSWLNTRTRFGYITITLHWVTAIVVIALFALGFWMVDLNYYSQWYQRAPNIHRSVGLLLAFATICRLFIRFYSTKPEALFNHKLYEKRLSFLVQVVMYSALFTLFVSGYLITTAKGDSIFVFDWFSIPALITTVDNLEDYAGFVHKWVAYGLMGIASIHALAALNHHFIDRDGTLLRILGN